MILWYIIIGFFVIGICIWLGKQILFNPRVNSVLTIILFLLVVINRREASIMLAAIIPIVDCIRDIVIAEKYYEDIEIEIDKLFMVKSLTSLFTFGLARVVFLLFVGPLISYSVSSDIRRRIAAGYPLPGKSNYKNLEAKNYYYNKQIDKLEKDGLIISNVETVKKEMDIRRNNLDGLYPEKLLAKCVDMLVGDKEMKEKRKEVEKKLTLDSVRKCYAYLSPPLFERYPQLISEVMSKKGTCPLSKIKEFEELKDLNLMLPLNAKTYKGNEWSEYFIIQALQPLVADGIFEDNNFNDRDPFDNHAYRYTKSVVAMPSIDANSDPRFALDDD